MSLELEFNSSKKLGFFIKNYQRLHYIYENCTILTKFPHVSDFAVYSVVTEMEHFWVSIQ